MSENVVTLMEKSEDKKKALEAALSQIEKNYGKGSVMKLGDPENIVEIESVSTGSLGLDIALGIGGLPRNAEIIIQSGSASQLVALAERFLCVGKELVAQKILHRAIQAEPHNRYARRLLWAQRGDFSSALTLVQLLQQFEFNVPDTIDTTVAGTTPEITREITLSADQLEEALRSYSSSEDSANSSRSTIPQRPSRETSKSGTNSVSETLGGFSTFS